MALFFNGVPCCASVCVCVSLLCARGIQSAAVRSACSLQHTLMMMMMTMMLSDAMEVMKMMKVGSGWRLCSQFQTGNRLNRSGLALLSSGAFRARCVTLWINGLNPGHVFSIR